MTLKDVVDFIRANDIDHEQWTDEELGQAIDNCIYSNGFGYVTDGDNKLKGIYMGVWESGDTFKVFCLVGKGALKYLIKSFKFKYPNCHKIVGMRHQHSIGEVGKYSKQLKRVEIRTENL